MWRGIDSVDPAFGHWFAGFVDGEGCFDIDYNHITGVYQPRFKLSLRDDDLAIVQEIHGTLGLGVVSRPANRLPSNPGVRLTIIAKSDCCALVRLFELYPLRAKKARDFVLWAQAVRLHATRRPGDGWEEIAEIRAQLKRIRQYQPSESDHSRAEKLPRPVQPTLGEAA